MKEIKVTVDIKINSNMERVLLKAIANTSPYSMDTVVKYIGQMVSESVAKAVRGEQ